MLRSRDPLTGALVIGGSLALSMVLSAHYSPAPFNPREFVDYRLLRKPAFTPPDPAFAVWGPIWAGLAASAWRIWRSPPTAARDRALAHWLGAQGLNVLWLWLGFGRRNRGAMALEAAGSIVNAAGLIDAARRVDTPAALLATPYLAWIGFAGLLSEELWRLNR